MNVTEIGAGIVDITGSELDDRFQELAPTEPCYFAEGGRPSSYPNLTTGYVLVAEKGGALGTNRLCLVYSLGAMQALYQELTEGESIRWLYGPRDGVLSAMVD